MMSRLRRLVLRFHAFLRPGRAEAELAREMEAHAALLEEQLRRRGLSHEQARGRRQARVGERRGDQTSPS